MKIESALCGVGEQFLAQDIGVVYGQEPVELVVEQGLLLVDRQDIMLKRARPLNRPTSDRRLAGT